MQPAHAPPVQVRTLYEGVAGRARLVRYAPGLRQAAHSHERPSLSVVLAGRLRETSGRTETEVSSGFAGPKPGDCRHAVTFGPQGAVILSIEHDRADRVPAARLAWRAAAPAARRLVGLLAVGEAGDEALEDLLALDGEAAGPAGAPAAWLSAAHARLSEEPAGTGITILAEAAGVDRAYFSRAFERAYGVAPSVYRRRRMVDLALARVLAEGDAPAQAAAEAGFADQSHMSRAIKAECGATLGRFRALFGA